MIEVYPMGRTQAEMRYILETVLSHLPPVTGSEENMKVHIVQKSGFNYSSSADEFGQDTGMGNSHYGRFLIHNHVICEIFWSKSIRKRGSTNDKMLYGHVRR